MLPIVRKQSCNFVLLLSLFATLFNWPVFQLDYSRLSQVHPPNVVQPRNSSVRFSLVNVGSAFCQPTNSVKALNEWETVAVVTLCSVYVASQTVWWGEWLPANGILPVSQNLTQAATLWVGSISLSTRPVGGSCVIKWTALWNNCWRTVHVCLMKHQLVIQHPGSIAWKLLETYWHYFD